MMRLLRFLMAVVLVFLALFSCKNLGPIRNDASSATQGPPNDEVTNELDALSTSQLTSQGDGEGDAVSQDPIVRDGCWVEPFWRHRFFGSSYLIGHCQQTGFDVTDKDTGVKLGNRTFTLTIFNNDGSKELYRSNLKSDSDGIAYTYYMDGFYDLPFMLCLNDEIPMTVTGQGFQFKRYAEPESCHSGTMPSRVPYVRTVNYADLYHVVRIGAQIQAKDTQSINIVELIETGSYCPTSPLVITSDTYTVAFPFPYNLLGLLGFCRKLDTQLTIEVVENGTTNGIEGANVNVSFGPESAPIFSMNYTTDSNGMVITDRFSRVRGMSYKVCIAEKNTVSKCVSGTTATNANMNNLTAANAIKAIRNYQPVGGFDISGNANSDGTYGRSSELKVFAYDADHSAPLQIRISGGGITKTIQTNFSSPESCQFVPESCSKENTGVVVPVGQIGLPVGGPHTLKVEVLNTTVAGQPISNPQWVDFGESDFSVVIDEVTYFTKPSEVDAAYRMTGAPSSYNWGGGREYWIATEVPNKFNVKYLFILPTGEMYAWNPLDKSGFLSSYPSGTINSEKIAELDPRFYSVVYKVIAGDDDPTPGQATLLLLASEVDAALRLFGSPGSFNWGGGNEWWIQTSVTNEFGQKYVYLLPNGEVWAWDARDGRGFLAAGAAVNSKKIATLNTKFHGNAAALVAGIDYPEDLDKIYEFRGAASSRNWGGLDELWFQGKGHEFGSWYFILPNGHVYKWNPQDTKTSFSQLLHSVRIGVVNPALHTNAASLINAHTP